jgi:hypothetical protein
MARLVSAAILVTLGLTVWDATQDKPLQRSTPAKEKKAAEVSVSDLSLEVQVLRTLRALQLSADQQKKLAELAQDTAQPVRERKPKVGVDYRKALAELRQALVDDDDEAVEQLDLELDSLTEKEKPDLDDGVDVTEAARKKAPEALRLLKPSQAAAYIAAVADQVIDPKDRLLEQLEKVRALPLAEWKDQRDALGDEIARLIGGTDAKKFARAHDQVVAVLSEARGLSDDDFAAKKARLQKTVDEILADVGPTDVLRNLLEGVLADLLSNPRLKAGLEARTR